MKKRNFEQRARVITLDEMRNTNGGASIVDGDDWKELLVGKGKMNKIG